MGTPLRASKGRMASNGARTGGWKENPKRASRMRSYEALMEEEGGGDEGRVWMRRFVHWVWRRWIGWNGRVSD